MDYMVITDEISLLVEARSKSMSDAVVDRLVATRKELGLTQQNIADATGMQRANVARVESKRYTPTIEVLNRYADCMGLELTFDVRSKGA